MIKEDPLNFSGAYEHILPKVQKGTEDVFFLTKNKSTWQLNYCNAKESRRIELFTFPHRILNYWLAAANDTVLFSYDKGGDEKQQLAKWNSKTGQTEYLTHKPDCFHYFGCFSPDGSRIAYSRVNDNSGEWELVSQIMDSHHIEVLLKMPFSILPAAWYNDKDDYLLIQIQESNLDISLHRFHLDSKKMVSCHDVPPGRISKIDITQDHANLHLLTDAGKEYINVWEMPLDEAKPLNAVIESLYEIENMAFSADQRKLLYTENREGYSSFFMYDRLDDVTSSIPLPDQGVIESVAWLNKYEYIYVFKSFTDVGEIWRGNIQTQVNKPLLPSRGFPKHDNETPVLKRFPSFDGRYVTYYHYENDNETAPVIIYVHGGPESQSRPEVNKLFKELFNLGFDIVIPNVRGSTGFGRSFITLDDKEKRLDALEDIKILHSLLDADINGEKRNFIIMGHSYGGFLSLLALTHTPDFWCGGVSIMGMSNLNTFFAGTSEWRRYIREGEYGSVKDYYEFFERIAPLNRTASVTAPVLCLHGKNDTRVPFRESFQLVERLKKNKKNSTLIEFENEGHFLQNQDNADRLVSKIKRFVTGIANV